ncbi:YeeE/YedE [Nitrosospira lacus]|uniref:YeeE/YedE n=1 Tax=Nitrosospira lacus TaxID=1288494 RepID=A0A1W6SRF7_9PROT|nr:YeeE/YedE family protein [Nitrosospira lacus]ARO88366.1 YeeE/YedE [Nitrosospira lacus]
MLINWSQFTPWSALGGGAVIGMAVALLVLMNGRIAGISGIVGGVLKGQKDDMGWRVAFISGLVVAPLVWQLFAALPAVRIDGSYAVMGIAGLVVGLGTRYGSGCTSGHGVCGLSRLSPRSMIATLVFMGTGFATVYVIRHVFQI